MGALMKKKAKKPDPMLKNALDTISRLNAHIVDLNACNDSIFNENELNVLQVRRLRECLTEAYDRLGISDRRCDAYRNAYLKVINKPWYKIWA